MKRRTCTLVLAATLSIAGVTMSVTAAEPPTGPRVGDILPLREGTFKEWTLAGADQGDGGHQPYALFWRNGAYLIALMQVVGRDSATGETNYKIVQMEVPRAGPNERILDDVVCSEDGSEVPIIAFYNWQSGIVRGIFAGSGALTTKMWSQDIKKCAVPDD